MKSKILLLIAAAFLFRPIICFADEPDSVGNCRYIPPVEYKANWKALILPAAMITTGAIFSQTEHRDIFSIDRSDRYPRATPIDDLATMAIGPSVFLFDLAGDEKHHPIDQLFLLGTSYAFAAIPVLTIKYAFPAPRPKGDGKYSFPSGHTALSFVGAHVIYKEFKDSNPWIAYSGYVMAAGVGAARMYNNRHWLCDVIAGAGIGILGTELAYAAYFPIRNHLTGKINERRGIQAVLSPTYIRDQFGMSLSFRF